MKLSIEKSLPSGIIKAPSSKSASHRLLICAGLSAGESVITNIAFSEDIKATIRCLEAIGCEVQINGSTVTVNGIENFDCAGEKIFDCGESGSTLRFFIPVCLLSGKEITLTGSEKLLSRPMSVYKSVCEKQGIRMRAEKDKIILDGLIKADTFEINGNISSQFISGLLFALPLLKENSIIKIIPPFESRPYVDMTLSAMKKFGVTAEFSDENTIEIRGSQKYIQCTSEVEGDWSNAAFFYAFRESGADIKITGTDENSAQGDKICIDYLKQLNNGFCTLNLADCPDLAPILFAFAAKNHGARFINTERLRMKESDRISCMQSELGKLGVTVDVGNNELTVSGGIKKPTEIISGHNDHRIVMSMAYLLAFTGGCIDGYEAVRKSYPDFFRVLEKAGVKINYEA